MEPVSNRTSTTTRSTPAPASAGDVLAEVHAATAPGWLALAERGVRHLASVGTPFQAWDVVELGVPEPDRPAQWGALFRHLAEAGLIVAAGAEPSRRPSTRGSLCRTWRGVP